MQSTKQLQLIEVSKHEWIKKNFNIKTLKYLGEGGYGVVYLIESLSDKNEELALKVFIEKNIENYESFFNEIILLEKCKENPNVVTIKAFYADGMSKEIIIVMEKADINLKILLNEKKKLPYKQILQILNDIVNGLIICKQQLGLHHLDIKPSNLLIFKKDRTSKLLQTNHIFEENIIYKLCDFGSAFTTSKSTITVRENQSFSITRGFCSPELKNISSFNQISMDKCDVYSVGLTIINCCGIEFEDFKHISEISRKKKYDLELKEIMDIITLSYPKEFIELIIKMLEFEYSKRIDLENLMKQIVELDKKIKENKDKQEKREKNLI